jgi:serine/threonine protein kinase
MFMYFIGVGTFGQVRECISLESNENFAVKIIEQSTKSQSWGVKSMARQEADLLASLGMKLFMRYIL